MDAKDIDRLKKFVALFDSPNEGERTNAMAAATALLKRHGKSMVDLPTILGQGNAASSPFAFDYDKWARDYMAGAAERDRARAAAEEAHRTRSGRNPDGTYAFYNSANPQDAAALAESKRKRREDYLRKNAPTYPDGMSEMTEAKMSSPSPQDT